MNRAIVTFGGGPHEELLDISLPLFERYAARHGYDVVVGKRLVHDRGYAWNKVWLLADCLKTYDEALWLDADLVVVNDSVDIGLVVGLQDKFAGKEHAFALVRHFTSASEVPNTGVWYCRQQAFGLLEKIIDLEVFAEHGWWEQAALMTVMGYTVPPQGSDFSRTRCKVVRETRWWRECAFLRVEWNSHPDYRADKPRIVHCSYPDMRTRIDVMKRLVKDPGYRYPAWNETVK